MVAVVVPSAFTFLPPPPSLLILFLLFFSSNPRPNILISDLGGLVDAIKEATNMNLDILGSAFVPVTVKSENVFDGGRCCWIWARGLESKLGSGWFDRAQSVKDGDGAIQERL